MRVATRSELHLQRRQAPARRIMAKAQVRATADCDGKWPLNIRGAFILGSAGLMWAAVYGVSLTLF